MKNSNTNNVSRSFAVPIAMRKALQVVVLAIRFDVFFHAADMSVGDLEATFSRLSLLV